MSGAHFKLRGRYYYVQTFEKCSIYTKRSGDVWQRGKPYLGGTQKVAPEPMPQRILKAIDMTIGLRVTKEVEIEGLDINLHGEVVLPEQAGPVHRQKGSVKTEEYQRKCSLAETKEAHAPGDMWKPIVQSGNDRKHKAAEKHVVQVRCNERGIVHLPVKGYDREHDAGKTADDEREHAGPR